MKNMYVINIYFRNKNGNKFLTNYLLKRVMNFPKKTSATEFLKLKELLVLFKLIRRQLANKYYTI